MKSKINKILIIMTLILLVILLGNFIIINNDNNKITNEEAQSFLAKDSGTLVLNYHEINNSEYSQKIDNNLKLYNVSLDNFKSHIEYIIENDINVITLDELNQEIKSKNFSEKNVVITFDDVDQSVYNIAYPILKENNIPFSLFIVTSAPGTRYSERNFANWDQIREMEQSGLATIGLHTHNMHYKENGEPVFLDDSKINDFENDLLESIDVFEEQLGYKPKYFAYPYGFGSEKTDEILMEEGIELIFSLRSGIVDEETVSFYIPRFLINEDNQEYAANWFES